MSGLVASVVVLVTNTSLYLSPGLRLGNKNVPASMRDANPATATTIITSVLKFASNLIRTLLPNYVLRSESRGVSTVARTDRNGVDKLQHIKHTTRPETLLSWLCYSMRGDESAVVVSLPPTSDPVRRGSPAGARRACRSA